MLGPGAQVNEKSAHDSLLGRSRIRPLRIQHVRHMRTSSITPRGGVLPHSGGRLSRSAAFDKEVPCAVVPGGGVASSDGG
jgi:hypothetical protein